MTKPTESSSENASVSKNGFATTPAMRRFLIVFAIVEAVIMGWALTSSHLR